MISVRSKDGVRRWLPWLVGAIPVLVLFANDLWLSDGGLIGHGVYWGHDFMNVWTGGTLVRMGREALLFDLHGYWQFARSLFGDVKPINYSYPPATYPLAATFSLLPYWLALTVWLTGTGTLFAWAARPWWPKEVAPWWAAVLTPAALINIWAGHYGFLIGALFLLGWRNLDRRPALAGVFFGLMLLKPHLAVLVPVALALRGEWKAFASAAVTCLLLIGATIVAYGTEPWTEFLMRTGPFQASLINAQGSLHGYMSPSMMTVAYSLGIGSGLALCCQIIWSVAALALLIAAARYKPETRDFALLVATCTFLVLPYSFNYDMTVVQVAALWLLAGRNDRPFESRLALFAFWAPSIGMALAAAGLPVMAPLLLAQAVLQYRAIARRELKPSAQAPFCATTATS